MIDIGDLTISSAVSSLQRALFDEIRIKITSKLWKNGAKLPSTRKVAEELAISRNTVTLAYEQLAAEGYIESRAGSGFFVCVDIPESFLLSSIDQPAIGSDKSIHDASSSRDYNQPFSPGIPDLARFPYSRWQRIVQHHLSRPTLAGFVDLQGLSQLRVALNHYLASSRSVRCNPNRIIITNGAQQALTIAMLATFTSKDTLLMENPGYRQMTKVAELFGFSIDSANVVAEHGLQLDKLLNKKCKGIYLTPSNQYPMGTSLNTEQRLTLLTWAAENRSWIIEDDYDSEFQFSHRPYASLQGLAEQSGITDHCIYIGSFSKTMFNSLRIGYMVVPERLLEKCLTIKDALAGSTPSHLQAALAEFISDGHYIRHLRKMRKHYQQKHTAMCQSISEHFTDKVEIISQAAGLHVTIRWQEGATELKFSQQAKKEGITIRPLSYYEHQATDRRWQSVVLGYGNVSLDDIDPLIKRLAAIFIKLSLTITR
ncbi:PLP-dependent aminotransferase family protein [Vibrio sp. 99-8-1]|uniref:MocR-like pyridoxine biosynthesis transcription factor PdxR n=1 Tax=Vibrio sp. 99-8-1 TaxID=2607602 RepID=UPI0014934B30|nr:PLP-dependent aminotransferase family protein [Vibrio sp. 99-8-1]NOI66742.1 PLP-dependent aminotransferase family protein [Vibrio sp. 99-8-1]